MIDIRTQPVLYCLRHRVTGVFVAYRESLPCWRPLLCDKMTGNSKAAAFYIGVQMSSTKKTIKPGLRIQVLRRDGYTCRYCGVHGSAIRLHLDHVYPEHKGGETTLENLATACEICNSNKHAHVGIWPKPIGYFDVPHRRISPLPVILTWTGYLLVLSFISISSDPVSIAIVIGCFLSVAGLAYQRGWLSK